MYDTIMQSCGHYIARLTGPLRDRLLRYYAETADQVQRLLRVTANGVQRSPLCSGMAEELPRFHVLLTWLDHQPTRCTQVKAGSCAGKFSSPHAGPEVPVTRPEALRSVVGHIRVCHLPLHWCPSVRKADCLINWLPPKCACRSNLR